MQTNVGATGRVARYTRNVQQPFNNHSNNAQQPFERISHGLLSIPCVNVKKQSGLDRAFVCDTRLLDQAFVGPGDPTGRPYILVYWTELGIAKPMASTIWGGHI